MTHTPEPYYAADGVTLYLDEDQGCLGVLPTLPDASVDAVVCDPPYALSELPTSLIIDALTAWLTGDRAYVPATGRGFMGRTWDRFVPPPAIWDECLRVLKPGGHLLVFAGARTVDLMGLSMRIAGAEIRDSISWIFGSGMPKSRHHLKPAYEAIMLARKPLAGTVAGNVLEHGTGALNIDGCRTPLNGERPPTGSGDRRGSATYAQDEWTRTQMHNGGSVTPEAGRWPTNVIMTHPSLVDDDGQPVGDACADGCVPGCPVADLNRQSGVLKSGKMRAGVERTNRDGWAGPMPAATGAETYGASRFFPVFRYEAKAPASERPRLADGTAHTTVKPLALMRWLLRLVTPPGGTVLDPFAGSGTTLEAAVLEGFTGIGIELERPHAELCRVRLSKPLAPALFGGAA